MGLFDFFKGRSDKPDAPKQASDNAKQVPDARANSTTFADVPVDDLLKALDRTSQALSRFNLSEAAIAEHVKTLNKMKEEISGMQEARAIPALSAALGDMFEKSLLKAYLYGDAQQIEDVKSIIFKAIEALAQVSSLKEQQIATLDVNVSAIKGEIWETDHQIANREKERQEKWDALENKDVFDLPESLQLISTQIKQLKNRNATAQTELDRLLQERHNIEADALGTSFMETQKRIAEYLDTLPSTAEYAQAAKEIEEIEIQNRARMVNDAKIMAEAVTGADEEMASFLKQQKAAQSAIAQPTQVPAAQAPAQQLAQPYSK